MSMENISSQPQLDYVTFVVKDQETDKRQEFKIHRSLVDKYSSALKGLLADADSAAKLTDEQKAKLSPDDQAAVDLKAKKIINLNDWSIKPGTWKAILAFMETNQIDLKAFDHTSIIEFWEAVHRLGFEELEVKAEYRIRQLLDEYAATATPEEFEGHLKELGQYLLLQEVIESYKKERVIDEELGNKSLTHPIYKKLNEVGNDAAKEKSEMLRCFAKNPGRINSLLKVDFKDLTEEPFELYPFLGATQITKGDVPPKTARSFLKFCAKLAGDLAIQLTEAEQKEWIAKLGEETTKKYMDAMKSSNQRSVIMNILVSILTPRNLSELYFDAPPLQPYIDDLINNLKKESKIHDPTLRAVVLAYDEMKQGPARAPNLINLSFDFI